MVAKEKMNTNRKSAIIVGVLFITVTVIPILTFILVEVALDAPDFLITVSANENQVLIGILLELIYVLAVVGIIVTLFPILKKHNEALALGFFSLRFIEALSFFVVSILTLTLLTLSQEFLTAGAPDVSCFQTFGTLLLAARDWNFLVGLGLVFSLSSLLLNYILYQSKLVPRWLSGWGLIGAALHFAAELLTLFGLNQFMFLTAPTGLQEMVFAVWLIVKGFNPSAIASMSAK